MRLTGCLLGVALALQSACTMYQYADNVKLVGVKLSKAGKHEKIGRLNDQICDTHLLQVTTPALDEAMNAASSGHKVSYFVDVTTDQRFQPGPLFIMSSCLAFMGDGYQ